MPNHGMRFRIGLPHGDLPDSGPRDRRVRSSIARILFAAALFAPLTAASCKPAPPGAAAREQEVRVLFIAASQDDPTWIVVQSTAAQFSAKHPRASVQAMAPPVRSPRGQQELLAGAARDRSAHAICIVPVDPIAVREAVNELTLSGIPVVTVGRDIPGARRGAYCGPSEFMLGEKLADACGHILQKHRSRTVMLLHAGSDNVLYAARYSGFRQGALAAGPLDILREVDGRADPMEAARRVRAETRRYPRIGCWAFLDDWPLQVIGPREQLFPLGVTIALCGAEPTYWDRLRNGQIQAMVGYDIQEAVEESLFRAVRLARDEAAGFSPERLIPVEVFTLSDLPGLQARWEAWKRGEPTDPASPPPVR